MNRVSPARGLVTALASLISGIAVALNVTTASAFDATGVITG